MNQLPLRLVTPKKQTRDEKHRHRATAKYYARRYAKTKDPVIFRLMMLHLKASLA